MHVGFVIDRYKKRVKDRSTCNYDDASSYDVPVRNRNIATD